MGKQRLHVLQIDDNAEDAHARAAALAAEAGAERCDVAVCATLPEALARLASEPFDVLLVTFGAPETAAFGLLGAIRTAAPETPVIALTRFDDPQFSARALQIGVQDCLSLAEGGADRLGRPIRHAIERHRYLMQVLGLDREESPTNELVRLKSMCGPAPMMVTARSLGSESLQQLAPRQFALFTKEYSDLLERAARRGGDKDAADVTAELLGLADRLGALGAGPRDVVELHKVAMNGRLRGHGPISIGAYVQEGRLLMCQLLGNLVSYYRTLSWGRRPHADRPALGSPVRCNPEAIKRKREE